MGRGFCLVGSPDVARLGPPSISAFPPLVEAKRTSVSERRAAPPLWVARPADGVRPPTPGRRSAARRPRARTPRKTRRRRRNFIPPPGSGSRARQRSRDIRPPRRRPPVVDKFVAHDLRIPIRGLSQALAAGL